MYTGNFKRMRKKIHHKINQYQADKIAEILLFAIAVTGLLSKVI